MIRKCLISVVFTLIALSVPTWWVVSTRPIQIASANDDTQTLTTDSSSLLAYGVYSPEGTFENAKDISLESFYVPWRLSNTSEITSAMNAIRGRNRQSLVNLEPWPFNWNGLTKETLFDDIDQGRYDQTIRGSCSAISDAALGHAYIRWAHEPEITGGSPWAQGNPVGFVKAYRHFVSVCRSIGRSNLVFVWSPAGDPSMLDYWPGSDYVDLIGLTTLGFEDWDIAHGSPQAQSFDQIFGPKYRLVEGYGKNIVICELGVASSPAHQQLWLNDAKEAFASYPLLKAVVYFDARNPPGAWHNFRNPDWRINPSLFP